MKVWTIVNQKGGVGKTTSAVSVAGCLSDMGYKVLLVDLDPHASLSEYIGKDEAQNSVNLYDVFVASHHQQQFNYVLQNAIQATQLKNTSILKAHVALSTLDRTLGDQPGKGLILRRVAQQLSSSFDYMIVDCPPVLGVMMVNGMVAADTLLIPTQTEHLAMKGLAKMLSTVEAMDESLTPSFKQLVIPTQFDKRIKACISAFSDMRKKYKNLIWKGYIPIDTKLRDASAQQQSICQYAPNSRACFAYQKLVNEVIKYG